MDRDLLKEKGWCFYCKNYKETQYDNECMITRDYCYPAHKVENCEQFDWLENMEGEGDGK